ncbi:unnamed protein product [Polarella glacialis]|uniref:Uncharacterized protein n=1 Tax=Polarella glacialis TaxID=89957 RepID=A0A813JWR7_POLGL|nr:unnamed protein product [Polarella glacialis]
MGACLGKKAAKPAPSAEAETSLPPDEGSHVPKEEDTEWHVGGKYQVLQGAQVKTIRNASSPDAFAIRPQDVVTLIHLEKPGSDVKRWACILPQNRDLGAGWLLLSDPSELLAKRRLKGSWEVPGRYIAKHSAVVRSGASLASDEIAEVKPGEEVLVVEIGASPSDGHKDEQVIRLRARVKTESDKIGWLSLENHTGTALFNSTNLLGQGVAEVHQHSLHAEANGLWNASVPPVHRSVHTDKAAGKETPWRAGGNYRTLEQLRLLSKPGLETQTYGVLEGQKLEAGSLVSVTEVRGMPCEHLGECPFVKVVVGDGPQKGYRGWLRCAASDGRDLVDTRDQLEHQQVVARIEQFERMASTKTNASKPVSAQASPQPEKAKVEKSMPPAQPAVAAGATVDQLPATWQPARETAPLPLSIREAAASEDQPAEDELEEDPPPGGCSGNEAGCGIFSCRVLPPGKSVHKAIPSPRKALAQSVPASWKPPAGQLESWVNSVYARYNPGKLLSVPDLLVKYKGKEPELVLQVSQKYRVTPPANWLCVAGDVARSP